MYVPEEQVTLDVHVEDGDPVEVGGADVVDDEGRHGDRPGGQLDLLAGAYPAVGAHAVDLDGADRWSAAATCPR